MTLLTSSNHALPYINLRGMTWTMMPRSPIPVICHLEWELSFCCKKHSFLNFFTTEKGRIDTTMLPWLWNISRKQWMNSIQYIVIFDLCVIISSRIVVNNLSCLGWDATGFPEDSEANMGCECWCRAIAVEFFDICFKCNVRYSTQVCIASTITNMIFFFLLFLSQCRMKLLQCTVKCIYNWQ